MIVRVFCCVIFKHPEMEVYRFCKLQPPYAKHQWRLHKGMPSLEFLTCAELFSSI